MCKMDEKEIANKNTLPSEETEEPVSDSVEESNSEIEKKPEVESKIDMVDIDPNDLDEVERKREPDVDLEQFRLKTAKIEAVETVRINSNYAKAEDGKQHKLKVIGEVVHVLEKEGQEDINFRPTELLDLEEDGEGNLIGLPVSEEGKKPSKWQSFKKALQLEKPRDAIGKELPMRINHNNKTGKDYLGFMYL